MMEPVRKGMRLVEVWPTGTACLYCSPRAVRDPFNGQAESLAFAILGMSFVLR
jgi:hypothetical protein